MSEPRSTSAGHEEGRFRRCTGGACAGEGGALPVAHRTDANRWRVDRGRCGGGDAAPAFGELFSGIRFNVEGAWGARSTDVGDAFGSAYPYDNQVQAIEAYAERVFRPGSGLFAVRLGRFRTPFGIYAASDHAYIGYLRPPLIRYDGYFALSSSFLEHGANVIVGTPAVSFELSVGAPADVGAAQRPSGLDTTVRAQWFHGPLIVGASYLRSRPYQSPLFAHGHTEFGGIDVRWMRGGIQLRGEWLSGRPFVGTRTDGGYVDVIVHRPHMGPVTFVARVERLAYDAVPPFAFTAQRYTAGTRVRLLNNLSLSVGLVHHVPGEPGERLHSAMDIGLTYVLRHE
jgi:hypothetical protein